MEIRIRIEEDICRDEKFECPYLECKTRLPFCRKHNLTLRVKGKVMSWDVLRCPECIALDKQEANDEM